MSRAEMFDVDPKELDVPLIRIHWLIKSYGRSGRYAEHARILTEERVQATEVPAACERAIKAGAVEMYVIEVKPHIEKKRSSKDGYEL